MPLYKNIDQLITEQALTNPNNIALQFGDDVLSYQNFNKKVNQLANLLIANNIQIGDKVALALDRSAEMVIALLAIIKSGAAYIPLDPNFPIDRLNFMLDDSGAKLLFTSRKHASSFQANISKLLIEDAAHQLINQPDTAPDVQITGSDLAYILYTSGSTGKPKGVQIEHHSLLNLLLSIQKKPGLTATDTWLAVATISFDIAGLELLLPLITGARLIVADSEMVKDGHLLLETIVKEKVTIMQATPYTWRIMLASGWDNKLPIKVLCGGEAMPKDLADKLVPRCNELWNLYGPTETSIYSTGKQILADDKIITIGKVIDNTQVYILNEVLKQLPDGQEGEIIIAGEGVARGYLNRPDLTEEKFIDNPYSDKPGQKMYRTGDLGKITPEGEIQYMGRIDNQVKIRGFRIEIGEIEYNLIHQPNILEAVVVVRDDHAGNQRLVAYVMTKDQVKPAKLKSYTQRWIDALKVKLPDYMVPTDYFLISTIPQTPSGKVDRKALPTPDFNKISSDFAAAETETEKMIADIWTRYLGSDNLGIHDNFFELGGHSLIAVQIMTSISKMTGKLLPIATLFKYPTVHKLALLLQSGEEETVWKSLVPIKPEGSKTPLYIIHGEGLNVLIFNNIAENVDKEQPIYGLQSHGLNGVDEPLGTIEAMAASYVGEILEQNPNGPYALAGYSFGGYVAIEMARQLQAKGKEVKLLSMFDANFKQPESQLSLPKLILQKSFRQFRKAAFVASSLLKHPGVTLEYQSLLLKKRLQPLGLFKEVDPENIPPYMQHIVNTLRHAVSQYKMKPYNGEIHILRAKTRVYFIDDRKFLGWSKFALKGVVAHDVLGDHRDMLLPPHDKEFARVLQHILDSVA